jgi:hypothetical protein
MDKQAAGEDKGKTSSVPDDAGNRFMELLNLHNTNRIDYNVRKWETVKFFQTLVSALIGAAVAALLAVFVRSGSPDPGILMRIGLAALPGIAAVASFLAILNTLRESRLLFLEELQMFKLAKLLGLDIPIPEDRRWLSCDSDLLPRKWRDPCYGTGRREPPRDAEAWLRARTGRHGFLGLISTLFLVEIAVSLFLVALCFLLKPCGSAG